MRSIQIIILLALTLLSGSLYGQKKERKKPGKVTVGTSGKSSNVNRKKSKGDKMYDVFGYKVSAEIYESLNLGSSEMNEEVMVKLANSYRLNGDTYNSELWYARFVTVKSNPEYILYYAQSLQSNGKCNEAKAWFKVFDRVNPDKEDKRGSELALDCDEIMQFKKHSNVNIQKLDVINTDRLDFSPVYYKDGIVFTSSRSNNRIKVNTDKWTNKNFTDIYYAERDGDKFKKPELLPGVVNGRFHDGTATFTKAQDFMLFSRNNYQGTKNGKSDEGTIDLKIFSCRQVGDSWDEVQELPFNSDEFATCHPTLTADGQYVIFSSDRPGGYGGMDLYISPFQGSTWGPAINLGGLINTKGNEIFPSWINGKLYFGSNGQEGLGGLDIFVANRLGDQPNTWTSVENMGKPFNSSRDDFGFILNEDGTEGFFTSNRDPNTKDDIYFWKTDESVIELEKRKICVQDLASTEKLSGASITVLDKAGQVVTNRDLVITLEPNEGEDSYLLGVSRKGENAAAGSYLTNEKGTIQHTIVPSEVYTFIVKKTGYETMKKVVPASDLLNKETYCIDLVKRSCVTLTGQVKNKSFDTQLPNATVKVFNKCTGETEAILTDKDGTFEFCLDCGCDFEILGTKDRFTKDVYNLSTVEDCDSLKKATIEAKLLLDLGEDPQEAVAGSQQQPQQVPLPGGGQIPNYTQAGAPPGYVMVPQATLQDILSGIVKPEQGQVVTLSPLYYDFDKHDIRGDAKVELDRVAELLYQYPSMEILLTSHTDSRGTTKYNKDLSQRRASAAVKYLSSVGIGIKRMFPIGYGESRLLNECEDGINCSEADHQRNRRTEIKITKLDNNNVKVDYVDKLPQVIDPKKNK